MSLLGPGHALGSSGGPLDDMVSAFAVRGLFFNDFWDLFGRPGAPFFHSNEDLDAAIATCSFKMFLGLGLDGLLMILGCPGT